MGQETSSSAAAASIVGITNANATSQPASPPSNPHGPQSLYLPPAITIPPVPPQTYLHHTTLQPRPKLVLIGDSITEQGSSHAQGWVTNLSIRYSRRMDVLNRGMNGYNSRWGKECLPFILEEVLGPRDVDFSGDNFGDCNVDDGLAAGNKREEKECHTAAPPPPPPENDTNHKQTYPQYTFLIGYGANDSCLPNGAHSRHHVPLEEYASNLKQMVHLIQSWKTRNNNNNDQSNNHSATIVSVALLTPPPCDTTIQSQSRDNEHVTKLYARECITVAHELGIPVVDLWNGMQLPIQHSLQVKNSYNNDNNKDNNPSGKQNEEDEKELFVKHAKWKEMYLSDGLHLTPMGNYRLFELVVDVLDRPRDGMGDGVDGGLGLRVTELPRQFPDQKMVNAEDPSETFVTGRTQPER